MELDVGQPVLLPAGQGEVVGDSDVRRVEILCDRDELHATWSRFGPGRDGASPHIHRTHSDLFFVLAGELAVTIGGDLGEVVAPAGTLVLAPPLLVHGFRNNSADAEVRYLNFHAPGGGFADYLRGVTAGFDSEDPPADGGLPAEAGTVAAGTGVLVERDEIRVALLDGDTALGADRLTCLYVLEGELAVTAGEQELRATEGAWLQIPAGLEHSLAADGARVLEIRA